MQHLKRSKRYRLFGGVAGGLAEYFDIDPVIIRLLFILTFFWGGTSLLVYLILWLVLPEDKSLPSAESEKVTATGGPPDEGEPNRTGEDNSGWNEKGGFAAGIVLIFLGVLFLMERFIPEFYFREYWPLLLVIIGIVLVINSVSDNPDDEGFSETNSNPASASDNHDSSSNQEGFNDTQAGSSDRYQP